MAGQKKTTKETDNKKKATSGKPKTRLTKFELENQIDSLKRQLELEYQERHFLVETLHRLSRLASAALLLPQAKNKAESTLTGSMTSSIAEIESLEAARTLMERVQCSMTDNRARSIVYSSIIVIDENAAPFADDTKFGSDEGLGWDNETKRLLFNLISDGVRRQGCYFSAVADDIESLETVGDVVDFVKEYSLNLETEV